MIRLGGFFVPLLLLLCGRFLDLGLFLGVALRLFMQPLGNGFPRSFPACGGRLLDGAALMRLAGRPGGPWLGELQRQLLTAVMDDPSLNQAETLAELASKLMASN